MLRSQERGSGQQGDLGGGVEAHPEDDPDNLDELERLRIVDRTHLGHGPATYHLASAGHGHLVCELCGSMTEVPDELFGGLAQEACARYGFAVEPHRFAVIGLCASCQ
jgi:Fur family ferric uptake transcriptional regulator